MFYLTRSQYFLMMIKNSLVVLICVGTLAACDEFKEDQTDSGGGSDTQLLASAEAPGHEASDDVVNEITILETTQAEESPSLEALSEPPSFIASKDCGAGRYEFRTDADNKFHFDAYFAPGGTIDYNFSVQPNTGNWHASDSKMTFNGPFGAGASNHISTWNITSRAADCSVLQFKGKSFGQADVTATRV